MVDGLALAELGLIVILLVALIPVIWLVARRRWLATSGWVFDCSLREAKAAPSSNWMLGVARLSGEDMEWYRVFSVSFRPKVTLRRGQVHVVTTRILEADERALLFDAERVAVLHGGAGDVELAMAPDRMTAFLSWLEAAPPGSTYS